MDGTQKVVAAYARAAQPEEAYEWLQRMRREGVSPNAITYTSVIHGYARAAQPERAEEMLAAMREQARSRPPARMVRERL